MKDEKISHFLFSRNGTATPGHPRIPEQYELAGNCEDGMYKGNRRQKKLRK